MVHGYHPTGARETVAPCGGPQLSVSRSSVVIVDRAEPALPSVGLLPDDATADRVASGAR